MWPSDKGLKIFRNLLKVVRDLRKIIKSIVITLYGKQNNTRLLVDMEYFFSCSTLYCTRLLCLTHEISIRTLDEIF